MTNTLSCRAVKVLYIGGCGRSGSTLLDRMLGQVPGICSVGELTHVWRALLVNQECGCGVPIRECPFWHAVGAHAFGGWEAVDLAPIVGLQRAVVRQRYVPAMAAPSPWPRYRRKLDRYAALARRLYAGIQAVSGAALIVDSTKHYANAFFLSRVPGVDLHVVHLVRDSRGVAFSWGKTVARPEAVHRGAYMNCYGPLRSAGRWLGYNGCFEALAALGVPSTFVRYEDLVQLPARAMGRILARAGMPLAPDPFPFIRGREVHLGPNHTVAGNPMRFRVGAIRLQADDHWRTRMPAGRRRLVSVLTRPLLLRYGYEDAGAGRADRGASSLRPICPTAAAAMPAAGQLRVATGR